MLEVAGVAVAVVVVDVHAVLGLTKLVDVLMDGGSVRASVALMAVVQVVLVGVREVVKDSEKVEVVVL